MVINQSTCEHAKRSFFHRKQNTCAKGVDIKSFEKMFNADVRYGYRITNQQMGKELFQVFQKLPNVSIHRFASTYPNYPEY